MNFPDEKILPPPRRRAVGRLVAARRRDCHTKRHRRRRHRPDPHPLLDFPGGSLATFLSNANREGAALNVVGEKSDLAIDLPPMSLRNADSGAVASALSTLLQPRGFMLAQGNLRSGSGETVWVLRKLAPHEFQMAGLPQFQSFQLAPFLESQTVDDIIAALKLKFHPPTGILLVSAPTEGIFVVQSVLQQLRRAARLISHGVRLATPSGSG